MKCNSNSNIQKLSQIFPKIKKTFVLKHIEQCDDKKSILEQINNNLFRATHFLDLDSPILVGKKPDGPKFDDNQEPIPHTYVGSPKNIRNKKTFYRMNSHNFHQKGTSMSPQMNSSIISTKKSMKANESMNSMSSVKEKVKYDVVDDKILKQYYQDIKENVEKNRTRESQEILKSLPEIVKKNLESQEKKLTLHQEDEYKTNNLSIFLSKKTNKKEKDLLINKIDAYRIKRQLIDNIQSRNKSDAFLGNNYWIYSLRRPKNFVGHREAFVNIRSDLNPCWVGIRENCPGNNEIIRKPRLKSFDTYENFVKNPYIKEIPTKKHELKKIESMKNLEVNGLNLLKYEAENETKLPGRKKMYKKNQLDTLDFEFNLVDYDKNCEKILSNRLFAENYSKY